MLEDVYSSYKALADIVEWTKYNNNELFFKYIEHENDYLSEPFFAGIVCRYWGHSGRMYVRCNRHVPFEECYDCIIDSIKYVLDKRVWENPKSSLYKDNRGPDKAMHIAMKRQQGIILAKLTTQKRQSNFNTMSIEEMHELYNDSADGMFIGDSDESVVKTIRSYFLSDDFLDGIIIDLICYNNYNSFNKTKLINDLRKLNKNSLHYYELNYNLSKDDFNNALMYIKRTSNKLLEIKVNSLLYSLRRSMENG